MPLAALGPWNAINPVSDYMHAIEAGAHTGLAISQMQQRAQEHAAELEAQREQAASRQQLAQAQMEQATRYHQAVLGQRQAELAEKTRYEAARNAIDMAREQIALRKEQSSSEQMTKRLDMQDKALEMRGKQLDLQNSMRQTGLDFQRDRLDEMARHNRSMEGRVPKGPTKTLTLRNENGQILSHISGIPATQSEIDAATKANEEAVAGLPEFTKKGLNLISEGLLYPTHRISPDISQETVSQAISMAPDLAWPRDETDATDGTNIKAQFDDWLKQRNSR